MPEILTEDTYPLGETSHDSIRARSGRPLRELTLCNVRSGRLTIDDFSIGADTLGRQAALAADRGYKELASNFRRAAELVAVPDEQLLAIYEALRPGRMTFAALIKLSKRLIAEYDATETAQLILDAADTYKRAGLLRPPTE